MCTPVVRVRVIAMVILSHGYVRMLFATDSVRAHKSKPVMCTYSFRTSSLLVHVIVLHLSRNKRMERTFQKHSSRLWTLSHWATTWFTPIREPEDTVLNLPTTKRRVKRTNVKDFRELSIGVRKRKLLIKQSESNPHLSSFKSGRATDKRIAKSEIVKGETIKG